MKELGQYSFPVLRGHERGLVILICKERNAELESAFNSRGTVIDRWSFVSDETRSHSNTPNEKVLSLSEVLEIQSRTTHTTILAESDIRTVRKLKEMGIEFLTLKEFSNLYLDRPKKACQYEFLFTDAYGDVYPCCHIVPELKIGKLTDPDLKDKIASYAPLGGCSCARGVLSSSDVPEKERHFSRIAIEVGGACQAACTYCYENNLENYRKPYRYFPELQKLILDSEVETIVLLGGEVFFQEDTMSFLKELKRRRPGLSVQVATNGGASEKNWNDICNMADVLEITFNGFSQESFRVITKTLEIETVKRFCEHLAASRPRVDFTLVFMASPMVIHEIIPFLRWALCLNPSAILLHHADVYRYPSDTFSEAEEEHWRGSSFQWGNEMYWRPILSRIKFEVQSILENHSSACGYKPAIVADWQMEDLLEISDEYLQNLGYEPSIRRLPIVQNA